MVRLILIGAALVLIFGGGLAGCGGQSAPPRPAPQTKQAPPGPPGGLMPGPDPSGPSQSDASADQGPDGSGP